MFYNAKNGSLEIGNTDMNYISFGKGRRVLIMIPGVGDGLKTVKGMAKPFSLMYREFAKEYTVYVFSRKNSLEEGYSTKDMAKDVVFGMKTLGIDKASIIGVSQGGMIAQHMAIDYPEVIEKLVLVVTLGRQNEIIKSAVEGWIEKAKENNYKDIMIDFSERSYSEKSIKKYRRLYPIMTIIGKPKDFTRFIIQATSCITHDTYDELNKIKAETLIIGGDKDRVVGGHTSKELADKIPNCEVKIYEGLGHSAYEEAKDFKDVVLEFLKR